MTVAVLSLTAIVLLQLAVIVRLVTALLVPISVPAAAAVRNGGMSSWARRRAKRNPQTIPDPEERLAEMARRAQPIGL